MSIPLEVEWEGKRWDLIRNERRSFVYLTIDGRTERRKYGQVLGAGSSSTAFLAELVGVRACCFLDCVPCVLDNCERRLGSSKGNGDGKGTDDAPLLEYRIERGCSYARPIRNYSHSCVLRVFVKHGSHCSGDLRRMNLENWEGASY